MEKFIRDPIRYLEISINNANKMSETRKLKVITKSAIIGMGTGLCAFALSSMTGSSDSTSTSFSILTGLLISIGINFIYKAHQHGKIEQTLDRLTETGDIVIKNIKDLLQ